MRKIKHICLSSLLLISLWGCSLLKETVTIDVTSITFTGLVMGDVVSEATVLPLNEVENRQVRTKVRIVGWTKLDRQDKSVPSASFILIDDQERQYHFSVNDNKILISVTQTGKNPAFYETSGDLDSLVSELNVGLVKDLEIRNRLMTEVFTMASIQKTPGSSIRSAVMLSLAEGEAVKDVLDLSSWTLIHRYALLGDIEMTLTLSEIGDKVFFYKNGIHGYAVYQNTKPNNRIESFTFQFEFSQYDALKSKMEEFNALISGPSDLVKNAVFAQSYLWLSTAPPEPYSDWFFSLSETESNAVKTSLDLSHWDRIETEQIITSPVFLLKDSEGYTMVIGYTDNSQAIAVITSEDPQFIEQYLVPSNVLTPTKNFLFDAWDKGPSYFMLHFKPWVLTLYVSGSWIDGYKTKDFVLDDSQSQSFFDLLEIETWTIAPDQDRGSEIFDYADFRLTASEGQQILVVETNEPGNTYEFVVKGLAGPMEYVYFYAPQHIFAALDAYAKAHYPIP